jgi:hypothetical protein
MYKEKYLKYKTKYLDLKSQIGGSFNEFLDSTNSMENVFRTATEQSISNFNTLFDINKVNSLIELFINLKDDIKTEFFKSLNVELSYNPPRMHYIEAPMILLFYKRLLSEMLSKQIINIDNSYIININEKLNELIKLTKIEEIKIEETKIEETK